MDPDDSVDDDDMSDTSVLQYAGVLKESPAKKSKTDMDLHNMPKITISNAAVANLSNEDTIHTEGVLSPFAAGNSQKKSIMARLGKPVVQAATSSTTISKTGPMTASKANTKVTLKRKGEVEIW